MGTNRRSRRRSAARILNSMSNSKRPRSTTNPFDANTQDFETFPMEDQVEHHTNIETSIQDDPTTCTLLDMNATDQLEATTRTNTLESNEYPYGT